MDIATIEAELAEARTAALARTILAMDPTIEQLATVLSGPYGPDIGQLTITRLRAETVIPPRRKPPPTQDMLVEDRILAALRCRRAQGVPRVSSQEIGADLGLARWTAQLACARMADAGVIVRTGRTSGTRYALPGAEATT